jgi:peroxiredoxin
MSSLPEPDSQASDQPNSCSGKDRQREEKPYSLGPKSRRWFLLSGSVLILLAIIFWRPLQQYCLLYFLLRSEAPSEEVLFDAVRQASEPSSTLLQLWRTQRIPHRQFVMTYLSRASATPQGLFGALEPLLLEAVHDPDITVRESAFKILSRVKHPQLRNLALEQLSDADPAVRLIGLQNLRSIVNSNDVPIAMRLLGDSEPRVVVAAALLLHQATGQDFGLNSTHAMPQFTCIDTNPPPAPDMTTIRRGVQRAQEWWTHHQSEFLATLAKPVPPGQAIRLVTEDFTLEDSGGKLIQLSQLRGKTVLLSFWSSGAPASLDDVPALQHLQKHYSNRLAVLGVCIPAAPSCGDEHGHDHAHHYLDESTAGMAGMAGTQHMHCSVQDATSRLKIDYPMLADTKNAVGQRFSIEDLPAYVLIDAEGMLRRRFVGFRTEAALASMTEEVTGNNQQISENMN